MDPDELKAVVADFFSDQAKGENLVAVYLFGSGARGAARSNSDIDLGVLYRVPPGPTFDEQPFDIIANLSEKIGREVDLVVMNGAPVDLVKRILRDGQLLLERDRSARIAFEVRARNDYFDLLPILRLYRRRPATP